MEGCTFGWIVRFYFARTAFGRSPRAESEACWFSDPLEGCSGSWPLLRSAAWAFTQPSGLATSQTSMASVASLGRTRRRWRGPSASHCSSCSAASASSSDRDRVAQCPARHGIDNGGDGCLQQQPGRSGTGLIGARLRWRQGAGPAMSRLRTLRTGASAHLARRSRRRSVALERLRDPDPANRRARVVVQRERAFGRHGRHADRREVAACNPLRPRASRVARDRS